MTVIIILFFTYIFIKKRKQYRKEIKYRKRNRSKVGHIYFYRGKGELMNLPLVKIGRTNNMKQRMSSAKTSNPFGIWLLAVVRVKDDVYAESFIHKKFARWRLSKKNEWFWFLPVAFYMYCIRDGKLTKKYRELL